MTTRLPLIYVSHAYSTWTPNAVRLNWLSAASIGADLDHYALRMSHASLPMIMRTGHEFELIEVMYDEEERAPLADCTQNLAKRDVVP